MTTSYLADDTSHEAARLIRQARRFSEEMGPLLSDVQWKSTRRVLDIGCGPGGWALDIARAFPHLEVIGIDSSTHMLETAQRLAQAERVSNVTFLWMDATHLSFDARSHGSFDFIHCRLASSFMRPADWPTMIQACFRLLSPGATLMLIDLEAIYSNSEELEKAAARLYDVHRRTGRSFSKAGMSIGLTFMFPLFLQKAGFKNISLKGVLLNVCQGTEGFDDWRENWILMNTTFRPHVLALGLATESELDHNLLEGLRDMASEDFAALAYHVCASGVKPQEP